jgi:hypothetical protein
MRLDRDRIDEKWRLIKKYPRDSAKPWALALILQPLINNE